MVLYRIADGRYPLMDGMGAFYVGGRWHNPGTRVVYGSRSYACAMLEVLVHLNTEHLPVHFVDVTVTIPDELVVTHIALPDNWYRCQDVTADMGDVWATAKSSVALLVPSAVAKNETNVLLNPLHADFSKIIISEPSPVVWDGRLFT